MSNVVEQLTPNPVNHKHGENGCCPDTRAWEMEMMHQVWAAGLHDAANCFQNALEAKWKLESQRKVKPKTNSDRIRAMTDEELVDVIGCPFGIDEDICFQKSCAVCMLKWLRTPVKE